MQFQIISLEDRQNAASVDQGYIYMWDIELCDYNQIL